jgi:N-acetylneuraminic acid mutarotase
MVKSGTALLVAALSMASVSFAQDGAWTSKAAMPTGRFWLASSVVGEKVFAIGGADEDLTPLTATQEYDTMTNTWTTKASMPTARRSLCACAANEKIYAIGGYGGGNLKTVEEYNPATNTWITKADMPTARMGVCETVNGKIYVLGGGTVSNTGGTVLSVVEEYDPTTNTWTAKANLPRARIGHASSVVNGQIYVFGGFNPASSLPGGFVDKVDVYNPATNTWTTRNADLPTLRDNLSANPVNGIIYVIGGQSSDGGALSTVEAYDPASNRWITKRGMPTARLALTSAAAGGRIYAIGGTPASFFGLSTVEEYNPNPTAVVESEAATTRSFALHQNYPNPFNPSTSISYEIAKASPVVVKIFNLFGQEVRTLVDEKQAAGFHQVRWDGKDHEGRSMASGVYFYQLIANDFVDTRKMSLTR